MVAIIAADVVIKITWQIDCLESRVELLEWKARVTKQRLNEIQYPEEQDE